MKAYWERERPIEIRPVDLSRYLSPEKRVATQQMWIRATGTLGDDLALNRCVLAYASDFTLLDTALIAHGRFIFDPTLMLASLDHSIWFHRRLRVDDWLLYAQDSPSSGADVPSAGAPCSRGRASWWPRRRKKASSASATATSMNKN